MSYIIDQPNCSGCHMCRMHCPADAIRIKDSKYWINPDKCISCGKCKEVCHNGCITDLENPEKKAAPHDTIKLSCDVCVIGGGAAGMAAAAKAADSGKSVVLLEKNHELGGSAWYATGFTVHYSSLHEKAGAEDPRDARYQEFLETIGDQVNTKLVKRLFEANSDWITWLDTKYDLGKDYEYVPGLNGPMGMRKKVLCPWNDKRVDAMIGPGGGGWYMTNKHKDILAKNNGTVLLNTAAKELLLDEAGAITGVLASDKGGEIEISCKAAVVTTGAFSRSKEIMDKMQPLFYDDEGKEPVHIFTCSTCTGDGITMCENIGADIDYVNKRAGLFGPMRHPYPGVSLNIGMGPTFLSSGKPFYLTGMSEISDLAYDEKRIAWMITDDANAEINLNFAMEKGPDENGVDLYHFLKDWRKVLDEEAEDNAVVMADSLEELAEKLNFEVGPFVTEIKAHNERLKDGPFMLFGGPPKEDGDDHGPGNDAPPPEMPEMPDFMKRPDAEPIQKAPFYAIRQKLFHENSVGGMAIDENTSVLKNGVPIPGLYAAGDTTRGIMVSGDKGVNYIEHVFTALTIAYNSGYISGVEAAEYTNRV